jgi:hypothetical protein
MAATQQQAIVGVLENRGRAEEAIDQLHHAGFGEHDVGFVTREGVTEARTATGVLEENAGTGAAAGAVAGGAVGALAGIGVVAAGLIPGVGPVLAAGILAAVIGGAAGAALGTFAGPFIALGFSEDEARRHEQAIGEGRTVVVVRAPGGVAEAQAILERNGPRVQLGKCSIAPGQPTGAARQP